MAYWWFVFKSEAFCIPRQIDLILGDKVIIMNSFYNKYFRYPQNFLLYSLLILLEYRIKLAKQTILVALFPTGSDSTSLDKIPLYLLYDILLLLYS